MKKVDKGQAVILVLVIFLACSGFVMGSLQIAVLNQKIVHWDLERMQAWQAADAGLAWAHCCLSGISFDSNEPLQADLRLPNGACCVVGSTLLMAGGAREYTVLSTGSYHGVSCQASCRFTLLPPEEGEA